MVAIAGVKGSFNVGSAVFATSIFLAPMHDELGWSRTLIFGALAVRTIGGGLLSPLVGPMGDHPWAPRIALPIGSVLFGVSFILVKWTNSPVTYYLSYGCLGAVGLALTSNPIMEGVVLKWFVRKRASAITWMSIGAPTGVMIFPPVLAVLINALGWRDAWLWMGIGTIAIMLPLSLMVRTSPESVGLLPDGDRPGDLVANSSARSRGITNEHSFTRGEAVRSKSFWILCLGLTLAVIGLPGYQAHWVPYFQDIDFSRELATTALTVFGVFSIAARFVWGYLSSRHDIKSLMAVQAILAATGIVFILMVQNNVMLFAWAVYQGLTLAVFFQLQALLVVTYFGRAHIGAIRGVMFPFITLGSATGPMLLGALRDWQGSYTVPFTLVIGTWLLAGLAVYMVKAPNVKRTESTT
jgi:MFS family permease